MPYLLMADLPPDGYTCLGVVRWEEGDINALLQRMVHSSTGKEACTKEPRTFGAASMGPSMQLRPGAGLKYWATSLAKAIQLKASAMLAPSSWAVPLATYCALSPRIKSEGFRCCAVQYSLNIPIYICLPCELCTRSTLSHVSCRSEE